MECEIDDLPGEGFGFLLERLLGAGALDVYFTSVQMKKNRPGTLVTLLCRREQLEPLAALLLAESGSLGCRHHAAGRFEAERETFQVETEFGVVAVKRARFGGRTVAEAPEYEDCRRLALASGVPWREVHRAAIAAVAALAQGGPAMSSPRAPGSGLRVPREPLPAGEGRLHIGLAGGGSLRWAAADLTPVVEEARRRLDLSPLASAALGRSLTGAALLLRLAAKTPARLVVEIRGDGPMRLVLAEADQQGNLRGMVGQPRLHLPEAPGGKLPVGNAIGKGLLRVLREQDGASYQSQVALVTGEIGTDLAHYLEQSEQTQSAVLVGVLAKPEGVAAAGGMIVEVLPGAREVDVERLEANIARLAGVSRTIEEQGLPGLVRTLLDGLPGRDPRDARAALPLPLQPRAPAPAPDRALGR